MLLSNNFNSAYVIPVPQRVKLLTGLRQMSALHEELRRDLDLLTEQGKVEGSLKTSKMPTNPAVYWRISVMR